MVYVWVKCKCGLSGWRYEYEWHVSMGRNMVSMVGGGSVGGYVSMGGCEYGWS